MPLIQVALEVPDEIYGALLSGDLVRRGSVVRDAAGQIVVHLKEVGIQNDDAGEALVRSAAALAKQNKVILIGLGVAAVAAAAGGAIVHFAKSRSEKKAPGSISEVETSFNTAMKSYLDSARTGDLNSESLAEIIAQIDVIKEDLDGGIITIDFTDGQIDALVDILKDYTERLAKANNVTLAEAPLATMGPKELNIALLRHYLGEQQRIFEAA